MIAERIVARLEADTRDFETGMNRASGVIGSIGPRAQGATHGLVVMRQALTGLAFQATGTAGPVGRLAQGLLLLGGGSALVIGVAAGIAIISTAYKAITADAREAAKAQEDWVKALEKTPSGAVIAARMQLQKAMAEVGRATPGDPSQRGFLGRIGAIFESEGQQVTRYQKALRGVSDALIALSKAETTATEAAKEQTKAIRNRREEEEREREFLERLRKASEDLDLINRRLFRAPPGVAPGPFRIHDRGRVFDPENIPFAKEFTIAPDEENRILQQLRDTFGHLDEELVGIGVDMGRNIIEGIVSGMLKMEDILRRVVISLLSATLFSALGNVLSKLVGRGANFGDPSRAVTATTTNQVVGPAQFSLTMGGGLPAPTTPFAVMRDAEWIRLLTGSLIVAKTQGFRP